MCDTLYIVYERIYTHKYTLSYVAGWVRWGALGPWAIVHGHGPFRCSSRASDVFSLSRPRPRSFSSCFFRRRCCVPWLLREFGFLSGACGWISSSISKAFVIRRRFLFFSLTILYSAFFCLRALRFWSLCVLECESLFVSSLSCFSFLFGGDAAWASRFSSSHLVDLSRRSGRFVSVTTPL
jgi:hypothetical protein